MSKLATHIRNSIAEEIFGATPRAYCLKLGDAMLIESATTRIIGAISEAERLRAISDLFEVERGA